MKLIFQSFLYCCILAAVAHSAELEINPEQKKRLSMWIENRLIRDLVSVEKTTASEHFVRPDDVRNILLPHSSSHINIRTKRSSMNPSKRTGCSLGTCTVHDLAHRLHQLSNKLRSAPPSKISPQGYGRRRRALPEHRVTLRLEAGKMKPVWSKVDSQVHKFEALLRRT
ncbi:adrenomedullin a [Thalassophryne amazonica]|uniref:adrenomedullin a n=1 Tax=Thalassophryne amazonica TaxID=390379 RepID=UPI0014710B15|nr:adrenomedullin a [Thalassophryne amazonica]XP_034046775.1 adrenomedullin a [Thalassophryne amazonica]